MNIGNSFFDSLWRVKFIILNGLMNTLITSISALILGTILGIGLGLCLVYGKKYAKIPIRLYVDIIRGMPGLVTIFLLYYFLDYVLRLAGIIMQPLMMGILALTIPCSAQVTELTRGALQNIPKGQIEAGRAIGLRFFQIIKDIIVPQIIIQILPPWVNTATEIIKGSSLLSLVSISELLLITRQLVATNQQALKYFTFTGLIYFVINTLVEIAGKYTEKKINFHMGVAK
jgi:polar amino acid transport system permease protein